jgi:hypothetical protein
LETLPIFLYMDESTHVTFVTYLLEITSLFVIHTYVCITCENTSFSNDGKAFKHPIKKTGAKNLMKINEDNGVPK